MARSLKYRDLSFVMIIAFVVSGLQLLARVNSRRKSRATLHIRSRPTRAAMSALPSPERAIGDGRVRSAAQRRGVGEPISSTVCRAI